LAADIDFDETSIRNTPAGKALAEAEETIGRCFETYGVSCITLCVLISQYQPLLSTKLETEWNREKKIIEALKEDIARIRKMNARLRRWALNAYAPLTFNI
jgi:hypothetical protein